MSVTEQAPCFVALAKSVANLQACMDATGFADGEIRLLIPRRLGERIEAELCGLDPAIWQPFTPGIGIYADGHLKQMLMGDTVLVGWKLGRLKERKTHDGPSKQDRTGV